jgi:hypothetical protein
VSEPVVGYSMSLTSLLLADGAGSLVAGSWTERNTPRARSAQCQRSKLNGCCCGHFETTTLMPTPPRVRTVMRHIGACATGSWCRG